MSENLQLASNAVKARIFNASREVKLELAEFLSYQVEGAERSEAFKSKRWDGRSSFLDFKTGAFPAGFMPVVIRDLRKRGHQVQVVQKQAPAPLGLSASEYPNFDGRMSDRYDYQPETVRRLLHHKSMVAQCATGCHAPGQLILMFDGSLKAVEHIVVGDVLMGPDSCPRNVMTLHRGQDEMFEILPARGGSSFVVNGGHILSLENARYRNGRGGEWLNVSVNDYLAHTSNFRRHHLLHRSKGVTFSAVEPLPLDPYLLGLLLGDGTMGSRAPNIAAPEIEIGDAVRQIAEDMGMCVTTHDKMKDGKVTCQQHSMVNYQCGKSGGTRTQGNLVSVGLAKLGLIGAKSFTKFIPNTYKTASKEARLQLLAGLIDTDGSLGTGRYEIATISPSLADDLAFVARSLGFRASTKLDLQRGTWPGRSIYKVSISGDVAAIPVRVAVKKLDRGAPRTDAHVSGFKTRPLGKGDYFGFEVDGDNLYILGDFTITHNSGKSRIATMATLAIRRPTMFLTTRIVLLDQMAKTFRSAGIEPGIIGDGTWAPRRGVTCASVQTLAARLSEGHPERERTIKLLKYFEFVIGEEAHESGGNSYFDIMSHCTNAHYRLALTATPFMRPDGEANMRLMATFGSIGIAVSEDTLIERGILARPSFKYVTTSVPATLRRGTKWPVCYDLGIVENPERNRQIVYEAHRAAGHGLSVMILLQRKKHGKILEAALREAGLRVEYIAGEHESDERGRALANLASGKSQVLIGSTILDVGVDVPAVGMIILAGAGKAEVALRQRIGRGAREKHSGPNVFFVVDFTDDKNKTLHEHALTRRGIVEATPGFSEGILKNGEDFDYGQFAE